jgi:hypothetical protein
MIASKAYGGWRESSAAILSLFTSATTLVCCALPALLVSLGMGAIMAGLVSAVPQLIWLSEHKVGVFLVAAMFLVAAGWMLWRARLMPCPIDPRQAAACRGLRQFSVWVYIIAMVLYGIGFFFAFVAKYLI